MCKWMRPRRGSQSAGTRRPLGWFFKAGLMFFSAESVLSLVTSDNLQIRSASLRNVWVFAPVIFFFSLPKHLQACRFIEHAGRPVSTHRLMFVHVCCWGTSDLWVCRTPRLLAGGLSTHGGRADLIFHMSTALPWTPSLSPHGWLENCSVNTWLKYAILPAPSPTCCSPTLWASQLKATDVGSCV